MRHDLTELGGLDMLSTPTGCIERAQRLAAQAYGAAASWLLVNGTTVGIHAAMMASCKPGDFVVLSRNCHQSALAACVLCGTTPVFAEVEVDCDHGVATRVTRAAAAAALDAAQNLAAASGGDSKVGMLLVVSPSYFGTCCDLAGLAAEAHSRGVALAVDEAHGSHFGFHDRLPPGALAQGADVTIQSTHKGLPALTQASLLHVSGSGRVPSRLISSALQVLQTSSPSYLLMASLDAARAQVAEPGSPLLARAVAASDRMRERLRGITGLALLESAGEPAVVKAAGEEAGSACVERRRGEGAGPRTIITVDPTRLTVGVWGLGISGYEAADALRRLGVSVELSTPRSVVLVVTGGLSEKDVERAADCFEALAAEVRGQSAVSTSEEQQGSSSHELAAGSLGLGLPSLEMRLSPRDAFFSPREAVDFGRAAGRISVETLSPYPPGIPVAVPGAVLTDGALRLLADTVRSGGTVSGASDPSLRTLQVVVAA